MHNILREHLYIKILSARCLLYLLRIDQKTYTCDTMYKPNKHDILYQFILGQNIDTFIIHRTSRNSGFLLAPKTANCKRVLSTLRWDAGGMIRVDFVKKQKIIATYWIISTTSKHIRPGF